MPRSFKLVILFLGLFSHLIGTGEDENGYIPIYAGTQLAFYPNNAAPGYLSIQPYIFATRKYGIYNSHWASENKKHIDQLALLVAFETGITQSLDVSLYLSGEYSKYANRHSWLYGDTKIYLGWQLLHDQKGNWTPDFRLLLGESFPSGKFDHLNPDKGSSDSFGSGAYTTSIVIVLAKTFYTFPRHPYNFNLNVYYNISSSTDVSGFNCYGGTFGTSGKVKPGDEFIVNFAIQYSLTQLIALGIDIRYDHQNKTSFSGKNGRLQNGVKAKIGLPSSEQFSLAPCVEYCWSPNLSVAGGAWFTVAGRNSTSFVSAVANVYYYF